jgi:hypothetical protein
LFLDAVQCTQYYFWSQMLLFRDFCETHCFFAPFEIIANVYNNDVL